MHRSKRLFVLDTPAENLISKVSAIKYPVHFFSYDRNCNVLMPNDIQAEHFGASSISEFIGQSYYDIISETEI